ncbi:Xaa-Pro aminopeptidase [Motilimonas sp. E26]|uniref:Xaa-Pro aminopeptidase n=1 Tax=Motilimonas sp. E26 TaxID=2865674 RepID=UPI001E6397DA|nr:Xaa-Pro aminopeptidase [Motilimonas sp. E26]MCE0558666.1 Xaa-Pro aminopeptidase [Motilimonas sp. E26]
MQSEFHLRQSAFGELMLDNSAAIFVAANEQTRSRDTEYRFRQDSDFYYLTGFNEPDAWLVLVKKDNQLTRTLFCRPKDTLAEIWHGRRLGAEAAINTLAIDQAFELTSLDEQLIELLNQRDSLYFVLNQYPAAEATVQQTLTRLRQGGRQGWREPRQIIDWRPQLHEMRLFKSAAEIELMRKAADISVAGHIRAMKECRVGAWEYQLEAGILHEFAMHGARDAAYSTIVGGGENACILHYTENESQLVDGELVLIDAGAEYAGYAGDITRTFPVNGKFSSEQKAIYQLVLDAQEAALAALGPGKSIKQANDIVLNIMVSGLLELGIMQGEVEQLIEEQAYKAFYMHGLSHWLGLDVHDVGDYQSVDRSRLLAPGMVITVEPGLYISSSADVDPKWHGIGVRIEDDIVITQQGIDNLTAAAPKSIADIEALMAQSN